MSIDWGDMVQSWELADSDGPPYDGWLGALGGLAELRRYHEIKNWRPMWVEVQLDGIPDGLDDRTELLTNYSPYDPGMATIVAATGKQKRAPSEEGPVCVVAGTGFEPATSGL